MARVELPQSRLRARRKRRRARLTLFVGGMVLVACAIVVGLSYLPFLQARQVVVSGTRTLATSTIAHYVEQKIAGHYLWVIPKRNIFIYPKHDLSAGLLKEFAELKVADVHAGNFHTIEVETLEREPKALWCGTGPDMGSCRLLDEDGVVYAQAGDAVAGLVRYLGSAGDSPVSGTALQYLAADEFHSLTALVDAMSQHLPQSPITRVRVDANRDAHAVLESGFEIMFATSDKSGDTFERFVLALESDPFKGRSLADFEYLDLRFGDKLYYKLK